MNELKTHEAVAACTKQFGDLIKQAETALENHLNEHQRRINASASRVAALENELELYEALEQERRAALVRNELAEAINAHKSEVEAANNALLAAFAMFIKHQAGKKSL